MASFDELIVVLKSLLTEQFAPKPAFVRGVLGDGTGVVNVPNRPDYDYARFNRGSTEAFEIFNKNAPSVDGWPVLIGEFPWQPGLTQVVGTDWAAYEQSGWGDSVTTSEPHAPTHEWRDGFIGADPVNIYRRAIAPGRAYSAVATGTVVFVNAFEYHTGTIWPGTPGVDLAPIRDSLTTGNALFAGIYVDTDNTLDIVTGSTTVDTAAFDPPLVTFPFGTIPIARVRLAGGQGGIRESDFRDARRLWDFPAMGVRPRPGEVFINSTLQTDLDTALANISASDILRLGAGTFVRTSSIAFPANVKLRGQGREKTKVVLDFDDTTTLISATDLTVEDITILCTPNRAQNVTGLVLSENNNYIRHSKITGENAHPASRFAVASVGGVLYTEDSFFESIDGTGIGTNSTGTLYAPSGVFFNTPDTSPSAKSAINMEVAWLSGCTVLAGTVSATTLFGWYFNDEGKPAPRILGEGLRPLTDSNNVFQVSGASDSDFRTTINGAPSGTSVVYTTPLTSGSEDAINVASSSLLAKIRLYNETQGTYALISSVNTGTNTITVTNAADISAWANLDIITTRSQTNTLQIGASYYFDLEFTSVVTEGDQVHLAVGMSDSGGGGEQVVIHPWETGATSKATGQVTQSTQFINYAVITAINSSRFTILWTASGSGTATIVVRLRAVD